MNDYEKLGLFYLGTEVADETEGQKYLYESKDLTTHSVIVGMTGSGKTGLAITLLEEAAIDGIPVIAIDPKGDLGNLLLTFPKLRPEDFKPWIEPAVASLEGQTVDEYAKVVADRTREGLAKSDESPERIAKFADSVERTIYTPGSNAGVGLTVLKSFAAPPQALIDDAEMFRDKITASASGLLSLVGVEGDPLTSREHVLVSTILDHSWRAGRDLGVAQLIQEIQDPPFDEVGVFKRDEFYPRDDRVKLAMRLNNLLASPGFAGWLEGEPLNIDNLLYTSDGKPRLSILAISHLSEAERMFFVTLLLGEVLSWVRQQPGTSTLRAILYMDEVAGYFPPVSKPPSKPPMLTLLKQARAYGLGIALATQNPVDLDYKGLSNTGTWFLGRLQTERDKARVLEGLEGASAASGKAFARDEIEKTLAGLSSRKFLVNNVHEDAPRVIYTRWALSYLRGPLTRDQISTLMADRKAILAKSAKSETVKAAAAPVEPARPNFPSEVEEYVIEPQPGATPDGEYLWRPAVLGRVKLHFSTRGKSGIDHWSERSFLMPVEGKKRPIWDNAEPVNADRIRAAANGEPDGKLGKTPSPFLNEESYKDWTKSLKDYAYRTQTLTLLACEALDLKSAPGESEKDFRVRLDAECTKAAEREKEECTKRFEDDIERLDEKIAKKKDQRDREQDQSSRAWRKWLFYLISAAASIVMSKKWVSKSNLARLTTAGRSWNRSGDQASDVEQIEAAIEELENEKSEKEAEKGRKLQEIDEEYDSKNVELESIDIPPRKSDTETATAVVWCPYVVDSNGDLPFWKPDTQDAPTA